MPYRTSEIFFGILRFDNEGIATHTHNVVIDKHKKIVHLDNWQDFAPEVAKRYKQTPALPHKPLLFRGQSDASWKLLTTLERDPTASLTVADHYRKIEADKKRIETKTGRSWEKSDSHKLDQFGFRSDPLPDFEYMVYRRHEGHPSPLLDWTTCPDTAAFFAFSDESSPATHVSIYVYQDESMPREMTALNYPHFTQRGPYILRCHDRHVNQRAVHTTCTVKDEWGWENVCHEAVLNESAENPVLLWKFTLPSSQRTTVLGYLNTRGINTRALLGT